MAEEGRYDRIDEIIDRLNTSVPGISFDRDALVADTPEDYGSVELTGADGFAADGHIIDQIYRASVWICITDRGTRAMEQVQSALEEMAWEWLLGWSFPQRSYLYDINKVVWRWEIRIPGPLTDGETETEPDEDPDEDAGTETEG